MEWVKKAENKWKAPENFSADSKRIIQQIENALRINGKEFSEQALEALRLGNVEGFINALEWDSLVLPQSKIQNVLYEQAKTAGNAVFNGSGIDARLLFNAIDQRAVDYALNASSALIRNITDEMRSNIRQTIATATNGGLTMRQAASRIKTDLPLLPRDASAVNNFREKQFENFVRDGMNAEKAREKAEAKAQRYSQKLTRQRATTIARTEIVTSANQGRYLGWEEGVRNGYIDNQSVKEWIAEPDACPECSPLDGETVLWNETFSSGDDMPPLHPNCRCSSAILPPDYADSPFTAEPTQGPNYDQQVEEINPNAKTEDESFGEYKPADYQELANLLPDDLDYDIEFNDALSDYTGEGYSEMNAYLRSQQTLDINDELIDNIDILQNKLSEYSIPEPMSFIRGQSDWNEHSFRQDKDGDWLFSKFTGFEQKDGFLVPTESTFTLDSLVGQKWTSEGFLSTSAKQIGGQNVSTPFSGLPLQIHVLAPAGTKGMAINSMEYEFLMPHGTDLEIIKTEIINGQANIYMKVVNQ